MPDLLFFLLLGHFVGDYAFQTDNMAKTKGNSGRSLSLHVLVYTVTIGCFWWLGKSLNGDSRFFGMTACLILGGLYVQHWLQDYYKSAYTNGSKQGHFIDQAIHISVLYLIRIFA